MIISIYAITDYKKIILEWLNYPAHKGVATRRKLAEALNCQTPYISHVLNGEYHLSIEQAEACAAWMNLAEKEKAYFILLVLWARASTKSLKDHLYLQIQKYKDDEIILKKKLKMNEDLSLENQTLYYSSWHYSALHMALLNPKLQTLEALTSHFQLSSQRVIQVIDFLLKIGLIVKKDRHYQVAKPMLHLENTSPLLAHHHSNWRYKVLEEFQNYTSEQNKSLHYSGAISLSNEDLDWVKQKISDLLKDISVKIKDSSDESLICLNIDCFKI